MTKVFKIIAIMVFMTVSLSMAHGQEVLESSASQYHQVILTVKIPSNIPVGTKVTVNATWQKLYVTATPPTASKEFTVVQGVIYYDIVFYCPIDAAPYAISFCGGMNYYQGGTLKMLYISGDFPTEQSSSTTYCYLYSWNTAGCIGSVGPGGSWD